jgi:S1-C subfamily serine protease
LALASASSTGLGGPVGAPPPEGASPDASGAPAPAEGPSDVIENSVVKVFATLREPDVTKPWTKQNPKEISGSGVVMEGKRILTNAHMVLYASEVQIQANQSGDRISATVDGVAPGIDLAVLKLEDESFFASHRALQRERALPRIKDPVLVYGFPTGGTSMSITKGIVSRIEYTFYNFPDSGLRIQIDAAINHGNSGGPALVGDKVIGLAFSFLSNAQNIGYIIPSEEIDLMLEGIKKGSYKGKLTALDGMQTLENPALRKYLKLDPSVHGLVVARPYGEDPAYPLKRWDVVMQIGDSPIDDQGMIQLRDDLRVQFSYLFEKLGKKGTVPLKVARAGKAVSVGLPVRTGFPTLFPDLRGSYPSYFIAGPLVFSAASAQLLAAIDRSGISQLLEARASPLMTRRASKPDFEDEGLVFIPSPFFPSKLSTGYSDPEFRVVKSVNGIQIRNLIHLVHVLRTSTDRFLVFEFADSRVGRFVFPREAMIASTEGILNENGVRHQGSEDAMAEWSDTTP